MTSPVGGLFVKLFFSNVVRYLQGEMYAGALFFQQLLGWDVYVSTCVILLMTAVYTLAGILNDCVV